MPPTATRPLRRENKIHDIRYSQYIDNIANTKWMLIEN